MHLFYRNLTPAWARSPIGAVRHYAACAPAGLWAAADPMLVTSDREHDRAGAGPFPTTSAIPGSYSPYQMAPPPQPSRPSSWSLSTIHHPGQSATPRRILNALSSLPVRALATTGDALTAAANVEIHRYLPHDQVMPMMSLVVGHGGHATTMRALAHGLPLPMLPLFAKGDRSSLSAWTASSMTLVAPRQRRPAGQTVLITA